MFMIPILLSSGLIIYQVLQVPALASVVQRVNVEDVVTFHGRSYLWEDAIDWAIHDQRGLLFGNGYRGQYFLDLIPDVVQMWNAKDPFVLHLHSTSLEILVNQGLVILIIYCALFYKIYATYRQKHKERAEEGSLLPVVLFLLFIMQVDTFLYMDGLGFFVFAFLAATVAVDQSIQQLEMREAEPSVFTLDRLQTTELELV
jgi:O-antigen ligase